MELMLDCSWPADDKLMIQYHNEEWGKPVHDDQQLFELLILEGFQAGLSWKTVLHKRENFRKAFDNFDAQIIQHYSENKIHKLMQDASIIRNQSKIRATIGNAKAYLAIQDHYGSFDAYIWSFTEGKTIINSINSTTDIPVKTDLSDKMSKDLLKKGFKFVGSTICYSFMQACGMVNDHFNTCSCKNKY